MIFGSFPCTSSQPTFCSLCDGGGWVCEEHIDQPWHGPHACTCGAAGMPCFHCNSADDELPRLPKGFEPD
jgi:hypothetical protein